MLIKGITIEKGNPGLGDSPTLDTTGMEVSGEIPVQMNFKDQIGTARVYMDGNEVKADLEIDKPGDFTGCWPAISGRIRKKIGNVITQFQLLSVSICSQQNADPSIKTIGEQWKQ